jgi:hypothetical protein
VAGSKSVSSCRDSRALASGVGVKAAPGYPAATASNKTTNDLISVRCTRYTRIGTWPIKRKKPFTQACRGYRPTVQR